MPTIARPHALACVMALCAPGLLIHTGHAAGYARAADPGTTAEARLAETLPPLDAGVTVFTRVHVVPMSREGVLRDHTVVVEAGRITAVGPAADIIAPPDARVVDGAGRLYLMPGLCDMHVHLPPMTGAAPGETSVGAAGTAEQNKASLGDPAWRAVTLLLANGVTTARGLIGHDQHLELRRRANSGELLSPTLYVAGPPVTAHSAGTPDQAREMVRRQKDQGFDCVKSHRVINPEVYQAAQDAGLEFDIPMTGHVDNEVGIERAIASRQQVEHMDGCLAYLMKDQNKAVQFGQIPPPLFITEFDESRLPELAGKLAAAGIWVTPTLSLFSRIVDPGPTTDEMMARPGMPYIVPQALQAWAKQRADTLKSAGFTAEYAEWFTGLRAKMVRAFAKAGVPMLAGSDSPQVFGVVGFALHEELESLAAAGLTDWQALQTATANPARYLKSLPREGSATGVPADFGVIEQGMRADLVLLEADPTSDVANARKIQGVMLRGKWLDRATLDSLLQQVERSAKAS